MCERYVVKCCTDWRGDMHWMVYDKAMRLMLGARYGTREQAHARVAKLCDGVEKARQRGARSAFTMRHQ